MSVTFQNDTTYETVDLCNRNARIALGYMGFDDSELAGVAAANEFYLAAARLLTVEDIGTPHKTTRGDGLCELIDYGLPAGYWLETANSLMALAHGASEVEWV